MDQLESSLFLFSVERQTTGEPSPVPAGDTLAFGVQLLRLCSELIAKLRRDLRCENINSCFHFCFSFDDSLATALVCGPPP